MEIKEVVDKVFNEYKRIDLKKLEVMDYQSIGDLKEKERVKLRKWEYLLTSAEIDEINLKHRLYHEGKKEGFSDSKADRNMRRSKDTKDMRELILKLKNIVKRYSHDLHTYEYYYFKAKT